MIRKREKSLNGLYGSWVKKVIQKFHDFWGQNETKEQLLRFSTECIPSMTVGKLIDWIHYPDEYERFLERASVMYQDFCRKYMLEIQSDIQKDLRNNSRKHSIGDVDEVYGSIGKAKNLKYYERSGLTHTVDLHRESWKERGYLEKALFVTMRSGYFLGELYDNVREIYLKEEDPHRRLVGVYQNEQVSKKHLKTTSKEFLKGFRNLIERIVKDDRKRLERDLIIFEKYVKSGEDLSIPLEEAIAELWQDRNSFYQELVLEYISRWIPYRKENYRISEKGILNGRFGYFEKLREKVRKEKGQTEDDRDETEGEEVEEVEGEEEDEDSEDEEEITFLKKRFEIDCLEPIMKVKGDEKVLLVELVSDVFTLSTFNHPNILGIRGMGVTREEGSPSFFVDLVIDHFNHTLSSLYTKESFLLESRLEVIDQVLCGLEELWRKRIVCQFLNPRRILVRKEKKKKIRVMLCDFGETSLTSKFRRSREDSPNKKKNFPYAAPETVDEGVNIGRKSDVYSFGFLVLSLLDYNDRKSTNTFAFSYGKRGKDISSLIRGCVKNRKEDRLSVENVIQKWRDLRPRIKKCLFMKDLFICFQNPGESTMFREAMTRSEIGEFELVRNKVKRTSKIFVSYNLVNENGRMDKTNEKVTLSLFKEEKYERGSFTKLGGGSFQLKGRYINITPLFPKDLKGKITSGSYKVNVSKKYNGLKVGVNKCFDVFNLTE